MELMQFSTIACILFNIMLNRISVAHAKPIYPGYGGYADTYSSMEHIDHDGDYVPSYRNHPLTAEQLSRLRRGYYYVDDGYIAAIADDLSGELGIRRFDAEGNRLPYAIRYTPVVRYKKTSAKRKKLFVPNLFG